MLTQAELSTTPTSASPKPRSQHNCLKLASRDLTEIHDAKEFCCAIRLLSSARCIRFCSLLFWCLPGNVQLCRIATEWACSFRKGTVIDQDAHGTGGELDDHRLARR